MKKNTFHHKTFPTFDAVCNEEYNETPYKSVPGIRMIDFGRALEFFISVNVFSSSPEANIFPFYSLFTIIQIIFPPIQAVIFLLTSVDILRGKGNRFHSFV